MCCELAVSCFLLYRDHLHAIWFRFFSVLVNTHPQFEGQEYEEDPEAQE